MDNKTIGKIKLDYKHYSGVDLYCDGDVEKELLEVTKNCAEAEYPGIIEEKASWPFLYHLSSIRENIVEWIPMKPDAKVLEVGSGCGAITGALSRKAGVVDCVDLSNQRSMINAYRHEYCENVTIHVGNFQDIEPDLDRDYDVICLIGVFEYGEAYIGGEKPFETFLNILKKHLKTGGKIVIAIENKMGLKYFAGCREDHSGKLFSGIEGYPGSNPAKTFTYKGLLKIAKECGFKEDECHMYYPYPDYKFMNTLFSDKRLPEKGELKDNLRNFDRSRLLLFDEKLAFENILDEGEFPLFSNSYILVLGPAPEVVYARYSNDRAQGKAIVTEKISLSTDEVKENNASGGEYIVKRALYAEGADHIKAMADNYDLLCDRYKGSKLEICPCELSPDGYSIYFPFVEGKRLEELLDEKAFAGDSEGFKALFDEYFERINFGAGKSVADMDMIFSNILVKGDTWTVIDYEWVVKEPKETKEIAFRALYCYFLENPKRENVDMAVIYDSLGVTAEQAEMYRHSEALLQKSVTGNRKALGEIREAIGNSVTDIADLEGGRSGSSLSKLQVYLDTGAGFNEKESFRVVPGDNGYSVSFGKNVKRLRLDPCDFAGMVSIVNMTLNGEEIDLDSKQFDSNGVRIGESLYVFKTDDPGFVLAFAGHPLKEENVLAASFDICKIPENISDKLPEGEYKKSLKERIKRAING